MVWRAAILVHIEVSIIPMFHSRQCLKLKREALMEEHDTAFKHIESQTHENKERNGSCDDVRLHSDCSPFALSSSWDHSADLAIWIHCLCSSLNHMFSLNISYIKTSEISPVWISEIESGPRSWVSGAAKNKILKYEPQCKGARHNNAKRK